jgi:hypothetical protein
MIIHFFPIFGDFSIRSYDFASKEDFLCSAPWAKVQTWLILQPFYMLLGYCSLEITHWVKQGLLVIQKTII